MIGSLGEMVFVANAETIRTFDDFKRSIAGRWAKHDILSKKPKSQRIGPGLDTISFTMRFDVRYGINPRKEMDRLVGLERDGKAMALTIGGKGVGVGLWIITSIEQPWEIIDNQGNVLKASVNISLEEYV
ncbi:phage tail protein [Paenibacillus sp. FJAT-26967]|uniref:phage tail protein n=1 Tax=Paenibacillus sp. FJAT-26967 TaxID=1729690 RepID=UPI0008388507|nr:phage tail protein [Paenibacillus sp. FJAT-26967]